MKKILYLVRHRIQPRAWATYSNRWIPHFQNRFQPSFRLAADDWCMTANDYQLQVEYSPADRGFLATVREFPYLYYVAVSKAAATEGLQMKLNSALSRRRANDFGAPAPVKRVQVHSW